MPVPSHPSPWRALWSRRWLRRTTCLIAAGGALAALTGWAVQRPGIDRWIVARLDFYARREAGLSFQAERLELHPFQGRVLFHRLAVGGDLLQADLLELDLEWATLLRYPHIRSILLVAPTLNLDQARLDRIRLRPHPPSRNPPLVRLDRLEIRGGQAHVREPAWALPQADFTFQAMGKGWSANQIHVDLRMPSIDLGRGGEGRGEFAASANLTDQKLVLETGHLRLGAGSLELKGGYEVKTAQLAAAATGSLDLASAQRLLAPGSAGTASGQVDFQAQAHGPLAGPAWSGTLQGKALAAKGLPLHPGNLLAAVRGSRAGIMLERMAWTSQDGRLEASGTWTPRNGCRLDLEVRNIPMEPLAQSTRSRFLDGLTAAVSGEARLGPGPARHPWAMPSLDQLTFRGTAQFLQDGQRVGGLGLNLERSQFQATGVDLELPELAFHGAASGTLGRKGLARVEGEAELATDAAQVAAVLHAWDIGMTDDAKQLVPLDMAGRTQAQARLTWEPATGIQLTGKVDIQEPRWHGALADRLQGDVTIDREELRVTGIDLTNGEGSASGQLWLTWADLPKGSDQLDMCYSGSRLPIREGLKAADEGDLDLDGTGSGWVHLHGTFDRIQMEGQAQAEQGEVYGLRIPAVSADFSMDIAGNRLRATDVRVADSVAHLGPSDGAPSGPLALRGSLDMDVDRETWHVAMAGPVDSAPLGLPGPRIQARVEANLAGPFTAPFGPIRIPTGRLDFTDGRIEGNPGVAGLEGSAMFRGGALEVQLGLSGKIQRLLVLDAEQKGPDRIAGAMEMELGPLSADTRLLASRFTQDFLKDAQLRFHAQGEWGPQGLDWKGQMDHFNGWFDGFRLTQPTPGHFQGDASGMTLAMDLAGEVTSPLEPAAAPASSAPARGSRSRPELPATSMKLQGRVPFSLEAPLAVELAGGTDLAHLKILLDRVLQPGQYSLLADMRPGGNARFDLNLGGSIKETTLDGTLALKNGRASVHSFPLSVDNLDFTAQFKGRDIFIPQAAPLRGTVAQGALTAWGKMTWRLGGISLYDLHTTLEDFQLRDIPDGFELQGSLDANLKGSDQDGGKLTGSIWAKKTLYRTEINLSDLLLSNALGPGALSSLDPSDPLARIDLDLEVHLAEPWELDTNLLKLQGRPRGPFWIRGNLTQPGLKGRMELMPGGRLTNLFPAGDIVLEHGTVEFADPTFFNPNIDVQGQIDIPPYLVTLNISGTLDALQAKPFSSPSLRQDEIFAILIDPAAVTTVGGAPGSSTQAAMNVGLAGTSTGLLTSLALADLQEQLRRTLRLDRVSVALRAGYGSPETSIVLGKSVNLFGYRTPLVFTHDKAGEVTTISGQFEWRFGDFVLRLGASQSTADSLAPSGEIRHSWSPR